MKKTILLTVLLFVLMFGAIGAAWFYMHSDTYKARDAAKKQDEWNEKEASQEKLTGRWITEDKEYDMAIWRDDGGIIKAEILKNNGEETLFWSCSGKYSDGENGFRYFDGRKEQIGYDMDGNETDEVIYEEGRGRIFYKDEAMHWVDEEEAQKKELVFLYEGEY